MSHIVFSIMPMFVCLFWVVLLLIDKQCSNLSKRFLAFFLTLSIINYFTHALFFNHEYELYTRFDSIWCFTSLAGYPLYYYYIRLLTRDTKIEWKWLWLIFPSLILAGYSTVLYLLMSPEEVNIFIHGVMYHESGFEVPYPTLVELQVFRLILFKIIFVVQVALVVYFGRKHILDYNAKIKDFYSDTGGKDLTPIKWLLILFIFASFISLISSLIGKDYFVMYPMLLAIPSVTHSLFLFGIGYYGHKQNFTIEDFQKELDKPEKMEDRESHLMILLGKKEIFTNPDLRITEIASMLNTNRTYASRLFNEIFHANFADTINKYRTEKAKNLMSVKANAYLSLEDIMTMSGFASESSFYRSFKKETGMSPGDFRKSLGSSS